MKITDKMTFKVNPWDHQLDGINRALKHRDFGLFWEPGTGKTLATINILRARFNIEHRMMRTLILAPLVVCKNWKNEFEMFSKVQLDKIFVLDRAGTHRVKALAEAIKGDHIIIINYEALLTRSVVNALSSWQPEILVCDESHRCKTPRAKRTREVMLIAKHTRHNYILTGTPILKDIRDIFSQFKILDRGATFGNLSTVFTSTYMQDNNAMWRGRQNYFPDWQPRESKYPELRAKIDSITMKVAKSECLDLPPLIETTIKVPLSKEQKSLYEAMERDFIAEYEEGHIVAELAVTKSLRLLQICGGILSVMGEEERHLDKTPRMDAVEELLSTLVVNHKVILWCSFRAHYAQLGKLCVKLKVPHVFLTGDQSTKEKHEAMDLFNNDPSVKVIIANRRAGGIGINLVAADYSIVYSRNSSLEEEEQSKARNYRGGSERFSKIVKYDLVAEGTIDEHVLDGLKNKKSAADMVIEFIRKRRANE